MDNHISVSEFLEAEGAEDWRLLGEGACAHFPTDSLAAGARFVDAVSRIDGVDGHPPAIDLRPDGVTVRLLTMTDDYYGPSRIDLEWARKISAAARELGLSSDPSRLQTVQASVDALVHRDVMPFWRAVLGYEYRPDSPEEDLIDPRGRGPGFWFQQMDRPREQRNRIHFDVWVGHDQAEARIAAAVAAGGRIVYDEYAPTWWVLADPEGNEACVSTALGRG